MNLNDIINVDPETLGGTPVFRGSRVPVKSLFEHLEGTYSLDEYLEQFPSVKRELAVALLDYFHQFIEKDAQERLREIAA